jgi:hypothetical protein
MFCINLSTAYFFKISTHYPWIFITLIIIIIIIIIIKVDML